MNKVRAALLSPAAVLSWILAMAAAGFAVSAQFWAQTLLLGVLGGLLVLFPPSTFLPKLFLLLIAFLLLLGAMAFCPAYWFYATFRAQFQDHGINLPSTLSPQPWLTLEGFTLLVATLLWAWACFEARLTVEARELMLAAYLVGLGFLALNIILHGTALETIVPSSLRGVGQFANRNHTGDLLVMGGIFSLSRGFSELNRQKMSGLLWVLLTGIFMVAIIRNGSRAAVVFFGLGLLLMLVLRPDFRRGNWLIRAVGVVVIVFGAQLFVFLDVPLRDRFVHFLEQNQEGRLPIYRDTAHLILSNPWCGIGLGNFEGVFNVQRVQSASFVARCLHPESDWFWLAAELGLVGVVLVALLVALTFRSYFAQTPCRRLNQPSVIVALLFLLHSLFDVGGHSLGAIWTCLYLVSFGAFRPPVEAPGPRAQTLLRVAGALLLVIAALRVQSMSLNPWMPTRASIAQAGKTEFKQLPLTEQADHLDRIIGWAPLDWQSYYRRAVIHLRASDPLEAGEADFNRALFLEQNSTELPLAIGDACRHLDISESLVAWQQLLRTGGGNRREEFLENLYGMPGLDAVKPALARKIFDYWAQAGDAADFIDEWPAHPEWEAAGWRAYANALAKAGRNPDAVMVGLQHLTAPTVPAVRSQLNLQQATNQSQASPHDPYYLIQLYFAQTSAGEVDLALGTLQKAEAISGRPAYVPYLLAKALASANQYDEAWQVLEPLVNQPP